MRSCAIDSRGIPDLTDLTDHLVDVDELRQVEVRIAIDDTEPERPWFYPLATIWVDVR